MFCAAPGSGENTTFINNRKHYGGEKGQAVVRSRNKGGSRHFPGRVKNKPRERD